MEEINLYEKLDLTKPWDHPDNLQYADMMPSVFRCPSAVAGADDSTTAYVAVIGSETTWKPDGQTHIENDFVDGRSNTIMIIESESHRTHWMSPYDVRFEEIFALDESGIGDLLTGPHPGESTQVGLADGSVRRLKGDLSADLLKALLTIAGGEGVEFPD